MRNVVAGVYVVELAIGQVYIWDRGDALTLIDAGTRGSADVILDGIASIGRQPSDVRELILTHYHDDHVGDAAELVARTGARVLAHRLDAPVIEGRQPQAPPRLEPFEVALAEATQPNVPRADPVHVDAQIEDGDRVSGGGVVVHVPGHTPGSIAIYVERARLLFTGDAIASHAGAPILGVFNVDRQQAIESLRRLAQLDFDAACFGHGEPLTGNAGARIKELARTIGGRAL
jgi:glyoxylase-like metal-dependent hydrolase (beta-lactamase superfamily II)